MIEEDEVDLVLEETFMVSISNTNASKDWPNVKVNPLVRPFLEWLWAWDIRPIAGTQSSGPHFYTAVFPIKDKQKIEEYFA